MRTSTTLSLSLLPVLCCLSAPAVLLASSLSFVLLRAGGHCTVSTKNDVDNDDNDGNNDDNDHSDDNDGNNDDNDHDNDDNDE